MPYLTGHELIHAKEAQLRAIGLSRYRNTGWLKRARAQQFTQEQIERFRAFKTPHPDLFNVETVKSKRPAQRREQIFASDDHFQRLGEWANRLYFAFNRDLARIPKL